MKTCLSLSCPERLSICCNAPCTVAGLKDVLVCSKCIKPYVGGECTAREETDKVWYCRFHPTEGFHEVGCPHTAGDWKEVDKKWAEEGKQAIIEAARYSNFAQALKFRAWEKMKSEEISKYISEKDLDILADIAWDYLKKKV